MKPGGTLVHTTQSLKSHTCATKDCTFGPRGFNGQSKEKVNQFPCCYIHDVTHTHTRTYTPPPTHTHTAVWKMKHQDLRDFGRCNEHHRYHHLLLTVQFHNASEAVPLSK